MYLHPNNTQEPLVSCTVCAVSCTIVFGMCSIYTIVGSIVRDKSGINHSYGSLWGNSSLVVSWLHMITVTCCTIACVYCRHLSDMSLNMSCFFLVVQNWERYSSSIPETPNPINVAKRQLSQATILVEGRAKLEVKLGHNSCTKCQPKQTGSCHWWEKPLQYLCLGSYKRCLTASQCVPTGFWVCPMSRSIIN